jgi:general secretion pathway protein F
MPVFTYRAADRQGQTVDGVMEATDARAVIERLHREAYFPVRVTPQGQRVSWGTFSLSRGVRARDLLAMTQQLATLVEAGMPLDRALSILEELAPHPRVKTIVADLLHSVRGGSSLSDALAKHHPRPFSRLYINMVRAGERGGVLEATLRRLAEFQESRQAFTEAIVSAMIYPAVITTVGAAAIVFLMTFVIPRFAEIFKDLGQAIPMPTQVLLSTSVAMQSYWWVGVLAVVGVVFAWRLWTGTAEGRQQWDRFLLRVPLLGPLIIPNSLYDEAGTQSGDCPLHANAWYHAQKWRARPRCAGRGWGHHDQSDRGSRRGPSCRHREAWRDGRGGHAGAHSLSCAGHPHGPRRGGDGPVGGDVAQDRRHG